MKLRRPKNKSKWFKSKFEWKRWDRDTHQTVPRLSVSCLNVGNSSQIKKDAPIICTDSKIR
jgi:hypothetical protein